WRGSRRRGPGGKWEQRLHEGPRSARLGHADIHSRQYRGRDDALPVPQRLFGLEGGGAGRPRTVSNAAQQSGDRGAANRTADKSHAADGGYELVDPVSEPYGEP